MASGDRESIWAHGDNARTHAQDMPHLKPSKPPLHTGLHHGSTTTSHQTQQEPAVDIAAIGRQRDSIWSRGSVFRQDLPSMSSLGLKDLTKIITGPTMPGHVANTAANTIHTSSSGADAPQKVEVQVAKQQTAADIPEKKASRDSIWSRGDHFRVQGALKRKPSRSSSVRFSLPNEQAIAEGLEEEHESSSSTDALDAVPAAKLAWVMEPSPTQIAATDRPVSHRTFGAISVDDAIAVVLEHTTPLASVNVDIEMQSASLAGRRLARDIIVNAITEPVAVAAADGFAVVASDGPGIYASVPLGQVLGSGTVCRVAKGDILPHGATAVLPFDHAAERKHGMIKISVYAVEGTSVSHKDGIEDQEIVLPRNCLLGSDEVGLLEQVGCSNVEVHDSPCVGVLSINPGKSLRGFVLAALRESGSTGVDLGQVEPAEPSLASILLDELKDTMDIIITTGGTLDQLVPALEQIGEVHFGQLWMKPGKSALFASVVVEDSVKQIFALPSTLVGCSIAFKLLVTPCLRRLGGASEFDSLHDMVQVQLGHQMALDPTRPEYHRVVLEWVLDNHSATGGGFVAYSSEVQHTAKHLSMRAANALLCIPQGTGLLEAGALLNALLLDQCGCLRLIRGVPTPHWNNVTSIRQDERKTDRLPVSLSGYGGDYIPVSKDPYESPSSSKIHNDENAQKKIALEDGYAVVATDGPGSYPLVAEGAQVTTGTVSRISKGQTVPHGATAVVKLTSASARQCGLVKILVHVSPGEAVGNSRESQSSSPSQRPSRSSTPKRNIVLPNHLLILKSRSPSPSSNTPEPTESPIKAKPEPVSDSSISSPTRRRVVPNHMVYKGKKRNSPPGQQSTQSNTNGNSGGVHKQGEIEIDCANLAWLQKVAPKCNATFPVVIERIVHYIKEQADESFVFGNVRGCGRKKQKVKISCQLPSPCENFLKEMVKKYDINSLNKAVRIVLDFAMEDFDVLPAIQI